ncbi:MAG TPA: rod shape-determining protein MreC [Phycisphaerae bacterium]|nr:rod shape-determining protein MreC [Phycisphaerae bacterium]HRW53257.1 rod shape-determining protein MreC [Phycisphaerae bacterium]
MLISALAVFLPPSLTNAPKHASTQLLAPLQDLARFLTFRGRVPKDPQDTAAPDPAILHELASRTAQNEQLRQDLERMQRLRDRSIPAALQAHVVAWDIVSLRDSAVIERGSELRVSRSDWVASHVFVDRGDAAGLRAGEAVIAQEMLLGRIDFVSPYMSRVKLFSDVDAQPVEVRFEGLRKGEMHFVDFPCTLRGLGRGQMIVRDVPYEYIDAASEPVDDRTRIRIGDFVTSAPGQLGLPVPLVIGHVTEIRQDPKQRLVYDVIIEATVQRDDIRYVHVIPLIPNAVAMD